MRQKLKKLYIYIYIYIYILKISLHIYFTNVKVNFWLKYIFQLQFFHLKLDKSTFVIKSVIYQFRCFKCFANKLKTLT